MKKQRILWAVMFSSMLAITGCGGSDDNSGSGNTNGAGNTNGGGSPNSTCEAICGGSCTFGGVAPGGDYGVCLNECSRDLPDRNDECGTEAQAFIGCLEAHDCNLDTLACLAESEIWSECTNPA